MTIVIQVYKDMISQMQQESNLKRLIRVLTSSVRIKYHYVRISQIFRDHGIRSVFFYIKSKFRSSILGDGGAYQLWSVLYDKITYANRKAIKKNLEKFSQRP